MPAKVNKFGFNANACYAAMLQIADNAMTECAERMVDIMKRQIEMNGSANGSQLMVMSAVDQVKIILHDIVDGKIGINVGIDEGALRGASEELFVRVMVVLHGNQAGGPLYTKPGQDTYKKHVTNKGPSTAKDVYALPAGFNKNTEIVPGVMYNTMNQILKYFNDMIDYLKGRFDSSFYKLFITVS